MAETCASSGPADTVADPWNQSLALVFSGGAAEARQAIARSEAAARAARLSGPGSEAAASRKPSEGRGEPCAAALAPALPVAAPAPIPSVRTGRKRSDILRDEAGTRLDIRG